jgi:hypothetical protein
MDISDPASRRLITGKCNAFTANPCPGRVLLYKDYGIASQSLLIWVI